MNQNATPDGAAPPATAATATDKKPAAKPKAAEPQISSGEIADANQVFARLFQMAEVDRRLDRALLDEARRAHERLMSRIEAEVEDVEAFKKKVLRSVQEFNNASRLSGGTAVAAQLYNKLQSIQRLIDAAERLR